MRTSSEDEGSSTHPGMPQGASFLINYARGKCVDVNAVADALKSGVLLGAAFDVFPTEPASGEPFKNVLQGCPNTILTPHIGTWCLGISSTCSFDA